MKMLPGKRMLPVPAQWHRPPRSHPSPPGLGRGPRAALGLSELSGELGALICRLPRAGGSGPVA